MKKILFIIIILSISGTTFSQQEIIWKKYNLKYDTPEKLKKYRTGSKNIYGRDNDNLAVDIEAVPFDSESPEFLSNVMFGAREVAEDMKFRNIKEGDFLPMIKDSYYVITEDKDFDNTIYPVIVLIILDHNSKIAFEITIDCYDNDLAKGLMVAKSFEFIN